MTLLPTDHGAKCPNLSLRMELRPVCMESCRSSWCHVWLDMGVVVLERKESSEKEFPAGSNQRKLVVYMPINWN